MVDTAPKASIATGQGQRAYPVFPGEALMTRRPAPPALPTIPPCVSLVAWTGDAAQLAARLGLPEGELLTALRRIGRRDKNRLTVAVALHNPAPLLSALRRKLQSDP